MTLSKRLVDLSLSFVLALVLLVPLGLLIVVLLVVEGSPIFYVSERMCSPSRGFGLIKLRTMALNMGDGGVTGGNKIAELSPLHRLLRRSRVDEIPQLWNVIRGDMSLVGPRPPLRSYVNNFPELYAEVLQNRPGVTGLASLRFHAHEEWLLAGCTTAAQTDEVYRRRCVPRKAKLDMIYSRNMSVCYDLVLIAQTVIKPFK